MFGRSTDIRKSWVNGLNVVKVKQEQEEVQDHDQFLNNVRCLHTETLKRNG
jgi:hypothetical protein